MRFSLSVTTRRCWRPATTRSSAIEVGAEDHVGVPAARVDRRLVADVREIGAGQARRLAGDLLEVDVVGERLAAAVDAENRDPSSQVGRLDEDLPVEAAGPEQRRIEILEPVRRGHHDHLVARPEAVELDEQLVQRLILLAVERVAAARAADGVELVDEDDRGRVLARLLEELADAGGAEAGEHLDERRGALRVEARAGLVRDRLGGERLAGAGRAVEQDALRHARAEALEALRVAQEVDHLLELVLRLVEPGDLGPRDRRGRPGRDLRRLHARHHLERPPEQVDDHAHEREEHDREPGQREVLNVGRMLASGIDEDHRHGGGPG